MSLNDILNAPLKNFIPSGLIAILGAFGVNSAQVLQYISTNPKASLIGVIFLVLAAHVTPSPAQMSTSRKMLAGQKPTGGA